MQTPETADFLTFGEFLSHWARTRPDALVHEQGSRRTTFAQLDDMSRRIARLLSDHGVGKGDRIAWLGKNADLYFQLLFSAAQIGVVMVPVGWRLAAAEMDYILRDTAARLIVAGEGFEGVARTLARDLPAVRTVFGEAEARRAIAASPPATIKASAPDDAVLQLYTSGTTGRPKGAVLSQRNLFGLRRPAVDANLPWARWDEDEAILMCMPCAHIGGTGLGTLALAEGARGIIQPEFSPENLLAAIAQGITRFFIVPAALQMMIQHPLAATTDFSRLKYVLYGAAPIPLELLREAVVTIPNARFMQCYGMTETSGTVCVLPSEDHDMTGSMRMRSAGKALPGVEIRVVGSDGQLLPMGAVGEIETRSCANMLHYWNNPAATSEAKQADNWVRTGDAAYLDADGYVYIQDRVKDMIISGGENIYPAEVESAIYGHPDVAEVAVIGVPDPRWGEAVKACVVAKAGHAVDPASVIEWARERIAAFKVPKSVDVVVDLPRNPSGKILRRILRERHWQGFERRVN